MEVPCDVRLQRTPSHTSTSATSSRRSSTVRIRPRKYASSNSLQQRSASSEECFTSIPTLSIPLSPPPKPSLNVPHPEILRDAFDSEATTLKKPSNSRKSSEAVKMLSQLFNRKDSTGALTKPGDIMSDATVSHTKPSEEIGDRKSTRSQTSNSHTSKSATQSLESTFMDGDTNSVGSPSLDTRSLAEALFSTPEAATDGRAALFDNVPRPIDQSRGVLHLASDSHIKHMLAQIGPVTLVRRLAEDLAQRDAQIVAVQQNADNRERLLRGMLRKCLVTNQDIDRTLASLKPKTDIDSAMEVIDDDGDWRQFPKKKLSSNDVGERQHSRKDPDEEILTGRQRPPAGPKPGDVGTTRGLPAQKTAHPENKVPANKTIMRFFGGGPGQVPRKPPGPSLGALPKGFLPFTEYSKQRNNQAQAVPEELGSINQVDLPPALDPDLGLRRKVDRFGFDHAAGDVFAEPLDNYVGPPDSSLHKWETFLHRVATFRQQQYLLGVQGSRRPSTSAFTPETILTDGALIGIASLGNAKNTAGYEIWKEFSALVYNTGVPVALRGRLWTECTYAGFEKAKHAPDYYAELIKEGSVQNRETISDIEKDLPRTLRHNYYFKDGQPGVQRLRQVLYAYAAYNPSVGYSQGMHSIVAYLLLTVQTPEEAFWLLVAVVDKIMPKGIFEGKTTMYKAFIRYLQAELPRLHAHFDKLGVLMERIPVTWFLTLFSYCLSAGTLYRVWDVFMCLRDGKHWLHKVSLALLSVHEVHLLALRDEGDVYAYMEKFSADKVDIDVLLRTAKGFQLRKGSE
ncbi:hypothetical protein LTR50_001050 [Elasticomyces elasticus]|nr:hypothetical protein LTR50_001050 [Elasticomyces elasticus]